MATWLVSCSEAAAEERYRNRLLLKFSLVRFLPPSPAPAHSTRRRTYGACLRTNTDRHGFPASLRKPSGSGRPVSGHGLSVLRVYRPWFSASTQAAVWPRMDMHSSTRLWISSFTSARAPSEQRSDGGWSAVDIHIIPTYSHPR